MWGRGETESRDARIVQSRGRHPAAPPVYSRGCPPQSALAGRGTRRGRGPVKFNAGSLIGKEAGCYPADVGSTPTSAALAFVVKWQSPPASNGKFRVQLLARAPISGGVTVACLSYKEKDLVRFKAGEPFSGLSVTEAYSPRTGEAEVQLLQPRPIDAGLAEKSGIRLPSGTEGSVTPIPLHLADVAQRQRHRGQNAASAGSNPAIGTILSGKRFRAAGESHKLLMVGSSPTPANVSASSSKKAGRPVLNWKTAGQCRQRPPLFGLVMKWKTSAVESRGREKRVGVQFPPGPPI